MDFLISLVSVYLHLSMTEKLLQTKISTMTTSINLRRNYITGSYSSFILNLFCCLLHSLFWVYFQTNRLSILRFVENLHIYLFCNRGPLWLGWVVLLKFFSHSEYGFTDRELWVGNRRKRFYGKMWGNTVRGGGTCKNPWNSLLWSMCMMVLWRLLCWIHAGEHLVHARLGYRL